MFEPGKLKHLLEDRATARKVEAAPFSLESLIAWLETKPAAQEYDWTCIDGGCLIGQYAAEHDFGHEPYYLQSHEFAKVVEGRKSESFGSTVIGQLACAQPRTFGGALKRALVLQANAVSG